MIYKIKMIMFILFFVGCATTKNQEVTNIVKSNMIDDERKLINWIRSGDISPNMQFKQIVNVPNLLQCYVAKGNLEIVKVLLEAGANPNKTDARGFAALHYISNINSCDILKLLYDFGGDINWASSSDVGNMQNITPLMSFVIRAQDDDVETLLSFIKYGAKVNTVSSNNKTALDIAYKQNDWKGGNLSIIDVLKQNGAKRAKDIKAEYQKNK